MTDHNGSIKEEVVEGSFNLFGKILDKWPIIVAGVIIYLIYKGKLDMQTVSSIIDQFGKLATAIKNLIT